MQCARDKCGYNWMQDTRDDVYFSKEQPKQRVKPITDEVCTVHRHRNFCPRMKSETLNFNAIKLQILIILRLHTMSSCCCCESCSEWPGHRMYYMYVLFCTTSNVTRLYLCLSGLSVLLLCALCALRSVCMFIRIVQNSISIRIQRKWNVPSVKDSRAVKGREREHMQKRSECALIQCSTVHVLVCCVAVVLFSSDFFLIAISCRWFKACLASRTSAICVRGRERLTSSGHCTCNGAHYFCELWKYIEHSAFVVVFFVCGWYFRHLWVHVRICALICVAVSMSAR